MFERTKVDNAARQQAVPAAITLSDGRAMTGNFAVPFPKTLFEVLNAGQAFVEFEPFDGEREYIAKAALRSVRLLRPPAAASLPKERDGAAFDPHAVLGITKGCAPEEVRRAYLRLSMTYHPDRYATAELPTEVHAYLQSMARRINTAYELLQDETAHVARAAAARSGPIYESRRTT